MTSSPAILGVYAALLVIVLLTPYASLCSALRQKGCRFSNWEALCTLLLVGALILTVARGGAVSLLCAALLLPLTGLGTGAMLGGLTAALLFATVTWWTDYPYLNVIAGSIFFLLGLAAGLLPRWKASLLAGDKRPRLLWGMLLCLLIGLLAGLITTPFEALDPLYTAWHHWSALLAPVEAWRGGGVPYRDFPIQYGLGPTTLLMASCGDDCWRGMFYTAIVTNAMYFATLAGCTIILTERSTRGVRWLALVALFCACFIWTGFPIQLAGPAIAPAVAGLRFLSISALLFYILLAEQRKIRRDWIGHAIWLVDLCWSPEAAFFGTAIWWPYLALRDAADTRDSRAALFMLVRGGIRGAVALAAGISCLVVVLSLLSNGSATSEDFLAYISHPPGMVPIKPTGTIWIGLASIMLATAVLARQGLSPPARRSYVCLLGFAAASIYYLSRSHDNNILNLFPLLLLVLLAILAGVDGIGASARGFINAFVHTMLAAMVAFVATFNFAPWQEGLARVGLNLGPQRMISRWTPTRGEVPSILPHDAVVGLGYLSDHNAGMIMLFDQYRVIPRTASGTAWTSVNNVANFEPLPGAMIVDYIQRGASTYRRPGWILVGPGFSAWALAFLTAYDVREEKAFGCYRAYYLVPRQSSVTDQVDQLAALALDRAKPRPRR